MILEPIYFKKKKGYKLIKCKICPTKKLLPKNRVCCSAKCTKSNQRKLKRK